MNHRDRKSCTCGGYSNNLLLLMKNFFFLKEPIASRNKRICGYDFNIVNRGVNHPKTTDSIQTFFVRQN